VEGQDIIREITYFRYCGEVNTEKVLAAARRRCLELGIGQMVVASETGRSALRALECLAGSPLRLVVVTHPPAETWGPRGDIPIGLGRPEYAAAREKLIAAGVTIVQGTRPLAPLSRSLGWDAPTPETVIDRTLELFGAGTKIAIEVAVMATDAGAVPPETDIVTCAGTFKGLDTALVVRTAYSWSFFAEFEVRESVARPRRRVHRLPEHESAEWKGDLEAYYR
jgi:hypothetical protein